MYGRSSRLKPSVQYTLLAHFVAGMTANAVLELLAIQPDTVVSFICD